MLDIHFHNRLLRAENTLERIKNNPAPTVPVYDLTGGSSLESAIAFDVLGGGSSTVFQTIPGGTPLPIFVRFEVFIPAKVINAFLGAPGVSFRHWITSFAGLDEVRIDNTDWSSTPQAQFRWESQDTDNSHSGIVGGSYNSAPLVVPDVWHTIDYSIIVGSQIDIKLDNVLYASHISSLFPPEIDPSGNWQFGSLSYLSSFSPELVTFGQLIIYMRNIRIGSTLGGTEFVGPASTMEVFTSGAQSGCADVQHA